MRVAELCKLVVVCALAGGALAAQPACDRGRRERERAAAEMTGGDVERGRAAIRRYGCGSCHAIPGVDGAAAVVAPRLDRVAANTHVAGVLPNTPANVVRWLQDPPAIKPLTTMPRLGVTDRDARDIAAYLYALK